MRNILLYLSIMLALHACAQSTISVTVEPQMELENYEHFKRLVLKTSNPYVDYIHGFTFEWGYKYTLKLKQTKFDEALSDGTLYKFELAKVVSKEKVDNDTACILYITPNLYYGRQSPLVPTIELVEPNNDMIQSSALEYVNDSTFQYLGRVNIEVPKKLKNSFVSCILENTTRRGRFTFQDKDRIRFVEFIE